jgi:hypothetical protein
MYWRFSQSYFILSRKILLSIYLYIYGSIILCWTVAAFSVSLSYTQSVGLLERVISQSQGRYLTHRKTQTQNKRTQTSMPRVESEPMIPAFERAKTVLDLDCAATVIVKLLIQYLEMDHLLLLPNCCHVIIHDNFSILFYSIQSSIYGVRSVAVTRLLNWIYQGKVRWAYDGTTASYIEKSANLKGKKKSIRVTDRGGPKGCETSRLPHFLDNRLTDGSKVVSLTGRHPLPPGRFLVLISVRGHSRTRWIRWLEKLIDLIGNRTSDLPACSIVPQPTTLPRAPMNLKVRS